MQFDSKILIFDGDIQMEKIKTDLKDFKWVTPILLHPVKYKMADVP